MIKLDKRTLQRIRIPLGFLFAAVFLIFARPQLLTLAAGAAVAMVGLGVRAWASGHIHKASILAVAGPYAFTRNPLYLGSFIMGVGFSVASGVWWLSVLFAVLFLGIYFPVMRVETGDIREIFGAEFDEYERAVPLFIPRLTPWRSSGSKFDFQLYLRYREYRAAMGVAAALGILAAKAYVFGY
jgi:protein-S-isoprenylcysteine O-methyltransferase Ste14